MDGAFDATIAVIADEESARERAGARGHEALAERGRPAALASRKRRNVRRTWWLTTARVAELEAKLSAVLEMLATMTPRPRATMPLGGRAPGGRGRRAAGGGSAADHGRGRRPAWWSAIVLALPLFRKAVNELDAAAGVLRRDPPAGGREASRSGADRGGDLRRDEVRSAPVVGRRRGADADPAADRRVPGAALRRDHVHDLRPRHARRSTSRTAATTCATCSTSTTATRCSRWPPTTAARRTSTAGSPQARSQGNALTVGQIPFPETRAYVQRVLSGPAGLPAHVRAPARLLLAPGAPVTPGPGRAEAWDADRFRPQPPLRSKVRSDAQVRARRRLPSDRRSAGGDRVAGARGSRPASGP